MSFAKGKLVLTLLSVTVLCAAVPAWGQAESGTFNIPRLDKIKIDGKADDWGDRGYRVEAIVFDATDVPAAKDFDPKFRLGWNDEGLLIYCEVADDKACEDVDKRFMYRNDSVTLFIAEGLGSTNVYNTIIASGADAARGGKLRMDFCDRRPEGAKHPELTAEAASTVTKDGYAVEILLPWKNLEIKRGKGDTVAFQIQFADNDGEMDTPMPARWYPATGAADDTRKMHVLKLADKTDPPCVATAIGSYEKLRRTKVCVVATGKMKGKDVTITNGKTKLAKGMLAETGGRAMAEIIFPMPPVGETFDKLQVTIDGQEPIQLQMPDATELRAKRAMEAKIVFDSFIFTGTIFPKCDFRRPTEMEDVIGEYKISAKYYDAEFNEVTQADKPGRYGAVVTVMAEGVKPMQRFCTLFCISKETKPLWRFLDGMGVEGKIKLPPGAIIDPKVAEENHEAIKSYIDGLIWDNLCRGEDSRAAALLAGLTEAKPGEPSGVYFDPFARDRQWWVTMKRKLYGTGEQFRQPLEKPQHVKGLNATVIHTGTLGEAGMAGDAPQRIDAVCKAWAADSDEAFIICVVRHGVVVVHKAYGLRDGGPMQLDTKSYLASITKTLSGSLMMQCVDQGLVNLDDPVVKYIVPLRGLKDKSRPLIVRDLYVHTSGLRGHWGDYNNDFEEIISDYYPHLPVGEVFSYNGAGLALGAKIMESVTGKSLPQLYWDQLINPLRMENTDVVETGSGAMTVAMDIAKVGQMLLNKGAYGDLRFFSEETFAKMLPCPLTTAPTPGKTMYAGVGLFPENQDGFPEGTFGHGSATGCVLRMDPRHDLLVAMTRGGYSANYGKHRAEFFKVVLDCMIENDKAAKDAGK